MIEERFRLLPYEVKNGSIKSVVLKDTFGELEGIIDSNLCAYAMVDKLNEFEEERNYLERKKCEYFNKWNKVHLDNIQLREQIKVFEKFLELNDLDIDWEYCCTIDECDQNEEMECKNCKYMRLTNE